MTAAAWRDVKESGSQDRWTVETLLRSSAWAQFADCSQCHGQASSYSRALVPHCQSSLKNRILTIMRIAKNRRRTHPHLRVDLPSPAQ